MGITSEAFECPERFAQDPAQGWAYWNFMHGCAQATLPHAGYELVRRWAAKVPLGAFSYTNNVDGHWDRAGWDSEHLVETRGAMRWMQCSSPCCPDVWPAPNPSGLDEDALTHRVVSSLPVCAKCGKVARPAVQMSGKDGAFSSFVVASQVGRYKSWLQRLEARSIKENLCVVCLEIGCSEAESAVRAELQAVADRFPGSRIIRVQVDVEDDPKEEEEEEEEPAIDPCSVNLPLKAGHALWELQGRWRSLSQDSAVLVIRDETGVAAEVRAPVECTPLHALLLLERGGARIEYGELHAERDPMQEPFAILHSPWDQPQLSSIGKEIPERYFHDFAFRGRERSVTACIQVANIWFDADSVSSQVTQAIDWCLALLQDLISMFGAQSYQVEVNSQQDREGVTECVLGVLRKAFPAYGLEASDRELAVLQTRMWMYGCCDSRIQRLAEEAIQLSCVRMTSHLPWQAARSHKAMELARLQQRIQGGWSRWRGRKPTPCEARAAPAEVADASTQV